MNTKEATIRRSILLPASLVNDAMKLIRPKGRMTFNGVVKLALQELIIGERRRLLKDEMSRMAQDRQIQAEYHRIEEDFAATRLDGLDDDKTR